MKGIFFILAVVFCLIVFGVPILECFMTLLVVLGRWRGRSVDAWDVSHRRNGRRDRDQGVFRG